MPNLITTLTTPRDRQARAVQEAAVGAAVLNLGELTLLDISIVADATVGDAVSVVRTIELHPGPNFALQIPTVPEQLATVNSLFNEVLGQTCNCNVVPATA